MSANTSNPPEHDQDVVEKFFEAKKIASHLGDIHKLSKPGKLQRSYGPGNEHSLSPNK